MNQKKHNRKPESLKKTRYNFTLSKLAKKKLENTVDLMKKGGMDANESKLIEHLIMDRLEDPLILLEDKAKRLFREYENTEIRIREVKYKQGSITKEHYENFLASIKH